jgi:uncharacterized protein YlzI (FlbEa/FlbD family)
MSMEIAFALFLVHSVDGREVYVNADNVITLSTPGKLVTEKATCLMLLNDGKFITVKETCDEVRKLMDRAGG